MSTRAIIGIKREDNKIIGAWNWCDGYDIKDVLDSDFQTLEDVHYLLSLGMFSSVNSKEEYEEFLSWGKKNNINVANRYRFIPHNNAYIIQEKHHIDREAEVYEDIDDVLGQDINVAYLFENGKWVQYK